jgi:hypothetical protein
MRRLRCMRRTCFSIRTVTGECALATASPRPHPNTHPHTHAAAHLNTHGAGAADAVASPADVAKMLVAQAHRLDELKADNAALRQSVAAMEADRDKLRDEVVRVTSRKLKVRGRWQHASGSPGGWVTGWGGAGGSLCIA